MANAPRVSGIRKDLPKKGVAATPALPTSPGATYVQAEAVANRTALVAVINALKAAGITTP